MDFTGKTALITGASGGIGGAIARAFHGLGATVGLSDMRREGMEALAAELGDRVHLFTCNLAEPGGPGFTEEQVKVIAAEYEVEDGPNDEGEMFERPARPSDRFKSPYPNKEAARAANGGAYPPDLSLMAKARKYGPDYLVALLRGYVNPPAGFQMSEGMSYNEYFPGHQIAMVNPLSEDVVEYTDGTPPTVENYAKDVSAFMMWAAEPKLEERKRMGMQVMAYLFVLAGFFYIAKRKVWRDVEH